MLSSTAGNFFAVVKSYDNNIAVIGNFALIAKNWNAVIDIEGTKQDTNVYLIDVVSSTLHLLVSQTFVKILVGLSQKELREGKHDARVRKVVYI